MMMRHGTEWGYLPVGSQGLARLTKQQPFKYLKSEPSLSFSSLHEFVADKRHTSLSPKIRWLIQKKKCRFCQQDALKTTFTF